MKHRYTIFILALLATMASFAAEYSGTLPVMFINTEGNAPIVTKEKYLKGTYYIDNMGDDSFESIGSADQPLPLQIKGRGNWTWNGFDKKPYRLKLDKKADLLGLGSNKHFALLAHADDSYGFLRNPMGFYLSRTLGLPWTPGEQPVELMLNGEYMGLYFLTETIRVDKDRVDITEQPDLDTAPDEITGGWLVEIDNYDTDPHITIKEGDGWNIYFTYKSPEELSPEQEAYLTNQMTTINSEIYSPNKQVCQWAAHVDMPTLAKFYIVQEIMDNYESFHGSCYLYKQRGEDEKWMFGPVWDFGSAFNYDKSQYIYQGREHHMTWIGEMCKFPVFMDVVKALWADFYATQYYPMLDYAQAYADRIAAAAKADAARWPQYGNANEQEKCNSVKRRLRASCKWLAKQWGGQQQPSNLDPITVYYLQNESNPWSQVYAYSWDNSPEGGMYYLFGTWPGSKMEPTELNGRPAFVITRAPEMEMSDTPGLIFGNGGSGYGNQTADLVLYNGHVYEQNGSHSTGLADIQATDFDITTIPGAILVNSSSEQIITISTVDGRQINATLSQGQNTINLPSGIYIIGNKKVAVR